MGRPDFSLMARQQRTIADTVGETAIWGRYISANALDQNQEAAGYGQSNYWLSTVITGLFAPVSIPEVAAAGGYYITGDHNATLIDCLPSPDDIITWRNTDYKTVSVPIQQQILGRSAYRMVLRRGQPLSG